MIRRSASDRLVVRMIGKPTDDADVRLDAFVKFLDTLRKLLTDTEQSFTGVKPTIYYTIAALSMKSPPTVTLRPRVARDATVRLSDSRKPLKALVGGYRDLAQGRAPRGFDVDLLMDYAEITEHFTRPTGLDAVEMRYGQERVELTAELHEQIERIIGPDHCEEGEVSGMLDAVQLHGRQHHFVLYPITRVPKKIKCNFGPDVQDEVGEAIKRPTRHVTVFGTLRFKAASLHPYAVNARHLILHPSDEDLPSFADLRGIAPDATGGVRSEDFVRRMRDAWR